MINKLIRFLAFYFLVISQPICSEGIDILSAKINQDPKCASGIDSISLKTDRDSISASKTVKKIPYLKNGAYISIIATAALLAIIICVAAATIKIASFDNPMHGEM